MAHERGHLVIIGGAEDRSDGKAVLATVAELAGGKDGRMVVFENDPEHAALVARATGVFMTGGDQSRLVSILGGSAIHDAMREGFDTRRACIAGTSAGASAMSQHMPLGGPSEPLPKKDMLPVAPGLGFLRNVVLDQHFSQRGRLARLLSVCAQNPFLLGVGIDEDTALIVRPGERIEVVGSGGVTILDGRDMVYTNCNQVSSGEALAITGVRLHLLPTGFRFHLETGVADAAHPEQTTALHALMTSLMSCG